MSHIKLFFALCAGYLAIWVAILVVAKNFDQPSDLLGTVFLSTIMSVFVFYPSLAIGFLFYKQNKGVRWLIPLVMAILGALICCGTYTYVIWVQGADGSATIIYGFIGLIVSTLISFLTIGFGALTRSQHRFTRIAGGVSLIGTAFFITYQSALYFELVPEPQQSITFLWLFLSHFAFGLVTLLMTVFLKSPAQKTDPIS